MKLYDAHTSAQACINCINYKSNNSTLFPNVSINMGASCDIDGHNITYLHCFDQTCNEFERVNKNES